MFAENAYSEAARKGQLHSFICTCGHLFRFMTRKSRCKIAKTDLIFPYSAEKWMLKIVE